jgi:hypothetical protein
MRATNLTERNQTQSATNPALAFEGSSLAGTGSPKRSTHACRAHAREGAAQIVPYESAVTAPCGQYSEGGLRGASARGASTRAASARHLSYAEVPGLSPRHFWSSVCANCCGEDDCAYCCCDDDAHPAKVRTNTIADTNFIDRPPLLLNSPDVPPCISVGCKIGASRMQAWRKMGVTVASFLNSELSYLTTVLATALTLAAKCVEVARTANITPQRSSWQTSNCQFEICQLRGNSAGTALKTERRRGKYLSSIRASEL